VKKKKPKFYSFKALKDKAELYIYGEIVSDKWYESDVTATDFKAELAKCKGKDLDIYINSPGGSVWEAQAIVSMLQRHDGVKTAYIDGIAASAASFIALSCDKVFIPSNAYLMIHKAWGMSWGNADELRKQAEMLDKVDEGILAIYMTKAKVSEEEMKKLVADESWFTGAEAIEVFDIEAVEEKNVAAFINQEILAKYMKTPEDLKKLEDTADAEQIETPNPNEKIMQELQGFLELQ